MAAMLAHVLGDHADHNNEGVTAVDRILDSVRSHLGMEIAFASRFIDGMRQFTHIRSDIPLPLVPGDAEPLEDTFCQRILDGRLPELIHNAADYPAALEMTITTALPIGSHLNVPLILRDGSIYGTFCCVSRVPDLSLTQRDLSTVRAFADLAASLIDEDRSRQSQHNAVQARIDAVLSSRTMTIYHQPIHALDDGRQLGVECLARFADAQLRPPNLWFDEADAVGRGIELEMLAVRTALQSLPYVPSGMYASINVSPKTLLSGQLHEALAGHRRERIVIELTEHAQVDDYDALRCAIDGLRDHARIAIDDVGAGYAGLRHILDLKPDILKLDMSLTRHIDHDPARRALAHAMVQFAAETGCTVLAEGVETEAECAALKDLSVSLGQGYLFSRPLPAIAAQQYFLRLASGSAGEDETCETMPQPVRPPAARRA